jgi:hypothetical protein
VKFLNIVDLGDDIMIKGTAYFGNRFVNHFERDAEEIAAAGCKVVLHTFSENDFKFYKDSLKEMTEVSKKHGLEVYFGPWGVGKVFGGEAFSDFLTNNVDEMEVIENGEKRGIACLYSEKFREFMKSWVDGAVYAGADVIFIDEPHWYIAGWFSEKDHWGCRCHRCQKKFKEDYGYEMPLEQSEDVLEFKADGVYNFTRFICDYAKEKGVRTSVCLLPSDREKDLRLYEKVAKLGSVDILGTDPYWVWPNANFDVLEYVEKYTKMIKDLCDKYNKTSEIWIQNFRIPADKENEVKIALDIFKKYNIDKVLSWGYRGSYGMSSLRCENPENIWRMFKES